MNIGRADTKYGIIYYLKNDFYIAQDLIKDELYSHAEIEALLVDYIKKSKVILDIGAHIGCHSIAYSKINPECIIHSFEIQKPIYQLLKKNIITNNLQDRIIPYNCAIGNLIKMVNINSSIIDGPNKNKDFSYLDDKPYNFGGVSLGKDGEECMMMTVDSLNLQACDFIKIDVEGFEYLVILGAMNTILKFHPYIYYECRNDKNISEDVMNIGELKNLDIEKDKNIVFRLLYNLGYRKFTNYGENILAIYD